jgi:hypothetical protein
MFPVAALNIGDASRVVRAVDHKPACWPFDILVAVYNLSRHNGVIDGEV